MKQGQMQLLCFFKKIKKSFVCHSFFFPCSDIGSSRVVKSPLRKTEMAGKDCIDVDAE